MTFDRRKWIVAHGVSAKAWAKRWGIEPGSAPCYHCKRELTTSIPFVAGKLRGLVSPTCECGNKRGPYCVVAADGGDVLEVMRVAKTRRKTRPKKTLRLVTDREGRKQ